MRENQAQEKIGERQESAKMEKGEQETAETSFLSRFNFLHFVIYLELFFRACAVSSTPKRKKSGEKEAHLSKLITSMYVHIYHMKH